MIGWLRGSVKEVSDKLVLLDVENTGYEITVTSRTSASLAEGSTVELYIHDAIRQDGRDLYGFENKDERALFRMLISVQKVGPAKALPLFDLSMQDLVTALRGEDVKTLSQVNGIGPKVAEKIAHDLRDKLDGFEFEVDFESPENTIKSNAIEGLQQLGYDSRRARSVVNDAWFDGITTEELLRRSLQRLQL